MKTFSKDYTLTEEDANEIAAEAAKVTELEKKLEEAKASASSPWGDVARVVAAVGGCGLVLGAVTVAVRRLSQPAGHPLPAVEAAINEIPPVA